jgi:integrase
LTLEGRPRTLRSAHPIATRSRPHTVTAETRHTYAQRHADAGLPVDVLRELLDHDSMDTTRIYYNPRELHQTGAFPQVAC